MNEFHEKLQKFIDNVCPGKIVECEKCPGKHCNENGFCMHPEHPSMKDTGMEFVRERSERCNS